MKISVNWMQRYSGDVKILPEGGIDELVTKIGAQLGAVEEVVNLGERYQGIVVAKVISCDKHPNADKLHVCKIDDGGVVKDVERDENGHVQVVCGAPNVRQGLTVAWIPPGATVPSTIGEEPFVLEARDLRGAKSNGMLASPHELAISEDHNGILEIDEDAKPGENFAKVYGLDDYIIDIENKMFTHRPDLFGQLGVAREVAGIQNQAFKSPEWYLKAEKVVRREKTNELQLEVKNQVPDLVPRFMAVALSDIEVKPSPIWLQSYLSRVGIRPINNVVDITNYMMMETAQPLHAYDADKLQAKSMETRMSKKGEKLRLLGGKEIEFEDESTIVITSGDIAVGIGGVMGGADTEVDANTKNIVLECANFDMYSIRRTAMKYGLFTDAVTRFNKGQSRLQNDKILAKAVEMLREFAGGKVASEVKDQKADAAEPNFIRLEPAFINARLGLELDINDMANLLRNVELEVNTDQALTVKPAFWRTDIEIAEDIVEEIGRLYGYDHLPVVLPRKSIIPPKRDELLDLKTEIRNILSAAGANEVLTYSFVHGNLLDKVGQDRSHAFKLSNALSPNLQCFRLSITPSLLEKIRPNIKAGFGQFALFEIGKTHNKQHIDDEDLPKEVEKTAMVVISDSKEQLAPYYTARKYLGYLAERFDLTLSYEPLTEEPDYQTAKPFDHKRSAHVIDTKTGLVVGIIGEYKLSILRSLKLPGSCAGFELSTAKILAIKESGKSYEPLSRFPKVEQDISLKVSAEVPYGEVFSLLKNELATQENVKYELIPLDIYQGESDSAHKKLTFRLTIASYEKTMVANEVNTLLDELAGKAHQKFGAERV